MDSRRAAGGGVVAGLIAGVALSVFMALMSVAQGQDVWVGAKMAALPFLGMERVTSPGFEAGPVLLGVLSHLAVSIFWGLLFGLIFYGLGRAATLASGVLWGIVVWLAMFYVVLPLVGAAQVARAVPVGFAVLEHVFFGIAVAVSFLPFQRTHRRERQSMRRVPATP